MRIEDIVKYRKAPKPQSEIEGRFSACSELPMLGYGIQSSVFGSTKDPSKATKIATLYGDDPKQDAYYQFLITAIENRNNPYFPRIKSVRVYECPQGNYAIVQMEKLEPFASRGTVANHQESVKRVNFLRQLGFPLTRQKHAGDELLSLKKLFQTKQGRDLTISHVKDPQLKQALQAIDPLFDRHDADLKSDNFMLRDGNQLVIVDPVISKIDPVSFKTDTSNNVSS